MNADNEHYRVSGEGMDIPKWVRPEERRHTTIHSQLLKFERNDDLGLVCSYMQDGSIVFLGNATIFSTLDAKNGYWQVEIAHDNREEESVHVLPRSFTLYTKAFWIQKKPGTLQRAMEVFN